MDGAQLHAVYPYAGERASIVLLTHDAVLGSIPDTVPNQAALLGVSSTVAHGLAEAQPLSRNYSTRLDWPLTSAVTDQAEATVHVGGYSFNDFVGLFRTIAARQTSLPAAPLGRRRMCCRQGSSL